MYWPLHSPSCKGSRAFVVQICFLFNHDQTHQIAHSLPIALALAQDTGVQVTLAVTHPGLEEEIRRIAGDSLGQVALVHLGVLRPWSRLVSAALDPLLPARRLAVYRDNLDFFRRFDAIVVSEKSSLLLKTRYGLSGVKLIHTRHGAGDRAIGFNRESARFDLVLVAGPKIRDRLIRDAGVAPEKIAIVGYSKFDLLPETPPRFPLQKNGLPTVLYNPHPSPHLSSWYKMGEAVLEQFYRTRRYNLIFAPHVMLFQRKINFTIDTLAMGRVRRPAQRYFDAPNMLIDLGSHYSVDMSYTQAADIYLGDVSSQIYEFLIRPRPCLFLDAHAARWQGNADYKHWQAGPVTRSADDIITQIDAAVASHAEYLSTQQALVSDTFDLRPTPSSRRAADAILAALQS
ncbi:MAG: CDP-glycerol glycerophosphotransferase family protein [Alphaproteobacteria bacterium]|nr:CDP-glycerol glycerophosphotransferase family protein [Alphaproteobacteria bacterium]